ncbi:2'-5' RNA ligase family protein [Streptococcus pneumoniae]
MYAVIAVFDEETNKEIRRIWHSLAQENISHYGMEIPNRRPHITLASYENIADMPKFEEILSQFCARQPVLNIRFSMLGTFLKSRVLGLFPTVTDELYHLHRDIHQALSVLGDEASLYHPDKWTPHCTLVNRVSDSNLERAYAYCQKYFEPFSTQLTELIVLQFHTSQEIEEIYRFPLQKY